MNFRDGVYMMAFQSHGEERGFEDRIQDCIGIVEYLNVKENELEWWWRNRERWYAFMYRETIFGGNTGDAGRIP